jgi:hypothetical protein
VALFPTIFAPFLANFPVLFPAFLTSFPRLGASLTPFLVALPAIWACFMPFLQVRQGSDAFHSRRIQNGALKSKSQDNEKRTLTNQEVDEHKCLFLRISEYDTR